VQIFYGDECARALGPDCTDQDQRTRSAMPWPGNSDVLTHWQKVGQFRYRHIAIGAGSHSKLADSPYTFSRIKDADKVVCVLGASGTVSVSVGAVFANGATVRDAYTGQSAVVSGGAVSLTAHANGVMLLEAVN
jgi:alpha-amylase